MLSLRRSFSSHCSTRLIHRRQHRIKLPMKRKTAVNAARPFATLGKNKNHPPNQARPWVLKTTAFWAKGVVVATCEVPAILAYSCWPYKLRCWTRWTLLPRSVERLSPQDLLHHMFCLIPLLLLPCSYCSVLNVPSLMSPIQNQGIGTRCLIWKQVALVRKSAGASKGFSAITSACVGIAMNFGWSWVTQTAQTGYRCQG